ncbi:hypothetical protein MUO79_05820 [Candidatus Bathyarchaeota archaeon]|nr:hypothetical protein [Candidatus Bathyarchaeota archaeon]
MKKERLKILRALFLGSSVLIAMLSDDGFKFLDPNSKEAHDALLLRDLLEKANFL